MKKLHFHTSLSEKIGFLFEDQQCKDIFIDRITDEARLGSIYLGKVRNVDRSIQAAFIDIGLNKVGFLPLKEIPLLKNKSDQLTDGASIIVQVVKEAYQDKGPRLSANITLTASHIVYLPYGSHIAVSKKLSNTIADQYKQVMKEVLLDYEGLILRTSIEKTTEEELKQELNNARNRWQEFKDLAKAKKAPALLFQVPLVPEQMLSQYQSMEFDDITFDNRKTLQNMQVAFPKLSDKMRVRKEENQIAGKDMQHWLIEAIEPVVRTPNGITLSIEQTEALTVIDIDSSRFSSRQNKQDTVFLINQQAIPYCAEEIQKRNLSGIIMIDFLKMGKKEETALLKQMKAALKEDPISTEVFGFTRLGLMEITRKRERTGLLQLLTNYSSRLQHPLSTETVAYQLERELIGWNNSNIESLIISCNHEVASFFMRNLKEWIEAKIHYNLYWQLDESCNGYHVIRSGSNPLIEGYIKENKEKVIDRLL
ncbi:ribonuclease E/G [Gracilibacillus kekensis]|uniref:Ribonuclease G n=1 Tax=Gracilibacillus kekensis TaxID=1027249 RepID=A0A1M7NXE9_9BACI|nr:ribonuclease E/G [Gracilibacillus kekensis]SHN08790.1 ribonuclease G [Gracilibacillus kekensis]